MSDSWRPDARVPDGPGVHTAEAVARKARRALEGEHGGPKADASPALWGGGAVTLNLSGEEAVALRRGMVLPSVRAKLVRQMDDPARRPRSRKLRGGPCGRVLQGPHGRCPVHGLAVGLVGTDARQRSTCGREADDGR